MKLWKVLARNSHVYTTGNVLGSTGNQMLSTTLELCEFKSRSPTFSDDSGKPASSSLDPHQGQFFTTVQLKRKPDESLGIILATGNSDLDSCPSIASFRPGSVASNCDQLMPGDKIYSVNGITTSRMRPDEVSTLLDNIDGNAILDIEYSLPNYASQNSLCVSSKIAEVTIERIDGSLGITLRGGLVPDHANSSRPLIITQVRQNGAAHRTGLIRVGDRLLKVDNHSLINKTLLEAQQILKENTHGIILTTLTIEYDVSIMESVKYATGPLLLEIDRQVEEDFGLVLTNSCDMNPDDIIAAGYYIDSITPASTADRCGALSIGDQILAIDDIFLDNWGGSIREAERLLRMATKLQVIPAHVRQRSASRSLYGIPGQYASKPNLASFNTMSSRRSRNTRSKTKRQSSFHKVYEYDCGSNYCGCSNNMNGISHPETLSVSLTSERGIGYGLAVNVGDHVENRTADILIARIVPDSPAYRCGCLQVGDRLISVNHQPNLTLQEINSILELGNDQIGGKVTLQIEFDVADTVVPSSGVFTVKLSKRGVNLGITITALKNRPDEPFIISEIRRGSVAHRTGTLHAGDRLLAIDNRPLDNLLLDAALDILQSFSNDIITLKIEKTETENSNLFLDSVVYTVELHRYGGPLGITISGSEDCVDPIVLSRLTEGGLAEKTGALHVGDRILAINGDSLEHKPLSEAIRLLQSSGDRVQLKIARNIKPDLLDENRCNYSSPGLMSMDSAIHSWDSNTVDNVNDNITDIAEIKDAESVLSEPISYEEHEKEITIRNRKRDSQLQFYSDSEDIFCPSPLPLPNYNFSHTMKYENNFVQPPNSFIDRVPGTYSSDSMLDNEIYHVTLYKDSIYDDYGFSVSDGLYEKGVYVNRIRKGGPADIVGLLKPYDRIIQVNDTKTVDFDCCLTVPLIASAGDRIELVIARNPYLNEQQETMSKRSFSTSQNTITKVL